MPRRRPLSFAWLVALLALGLMAPTATVLAQDASPAASPMASPMVSPGASPVAGVATQSVPRDAYLQQLRAAFPFEEPQSQGGQIIWSQVSDISTVNGLLTGDSPTGYVTYGAMFEALVGGSPVDGSIVPALADSYTLAPDGRTYTFNLNRDATWHDGTDFTAEDVKFTYDVMLDERSPNPRRSSAQPLIESYRVVDADTFEMVSKEPFAIFLYDAVSAISIMPRHIWESVPPDQWENDPGSTGQDPARVVGTGPFRFGEWRQGESVSLLRNDAYYVPELVPVVDELLMRVLPDPATEVEALRAGEVDIVEVIPAPQTEEIQNTEGLKVDIYPGYSISFLAFNMDPAITPMWQDQRVRQALFVAIDKEAIRQNIYLGFGEVPLGSHPPLSKGYAPDRFEETYAYDPERARQLLSEAGWTDTNGNGIVDQNGQEMQFELLAPSGSGAVLEQLMAEFQQRWREIGVEMTPTLVEWPQLLEITGSTHDFDMVLQGFNFDPSDNQGSLFRCDGYGGGFNDFRYCNPEYDRLDDLQLRELDPEARRELLIQQSQIIWNDLPVLIYRIGVNRVGSTERLHNFFPNGYGGPYWSWQFAWVEQ